MASIPEIFNLVCLTQQTGEVSLSSTKSNRVLSSIKVVRYPYSAVFDSQTDRLIDRSSRLTCLCVHTQGNYRRLSNSYHGINSVNGLFFPTVQINNSSGDCIVHHLNTQTGPEHNDTTHSTEGPEHGTHLIALINQDEK